MALTLHVEWSCTVCSPAGSLDFFFIFSCMTLLVGSSRHSESSAQCSDGGEKLKSYTGKTRRKNDSPPFFFSSSYFFFPALLSECLELASMSFCSLHSKLFMENCVLLSSYNPLPLGLVDRGFSVYFLQSMSGTRARFLTIYQ